MEVNPHFWAGKRVCVTGGTGFLGRHLVENLSAHTPHVRILGLRPAAPELDEWLEPYREIWRASLDRLERHLADPPIPPRRKRT